MILTYLRLPKISGSLYLLRHNAPLFPVQHPLGGFDFAGEDVGQGGNGFVDGVFNQFFFFAAGFFQHVVHHFVAVAGVADAQAQAVEVGAAEAGLNVFEAVVAAVAAAEFEFDAAGLEVELVVDNEDFLRLDFIKRGNGLHGLAGEVHIGLRLEQADFAAGAGTADEVAEEFPVVLPMAVPLLGELVEQPEAGVVAGIFVFGAGVAEADDEFDGHGFSLLVRAT